MSLPEPYYQDESCTIYHGDCRELLPLIEPVDLVLTDPPYGIASVWQGGFGRGWSQRVLSQPRNEWDAHTPDLAPVLALECEKVIWGGNYFPLPPARGWLVWNKPERGFSLADAELAWTSRDAPVRVFDFARAHKHDHPTQKPLELMRWCVAFFPKAGLILDPFMGSGTTLRAAKDLGRKAIGIEIEERYCEIAARRLSQMVLPLAV